MMARPSKKALRSAAFDLVAHLRRSGPENLTASELATVRAWFAVLTDRERVREVFIAGDSLMEGEVDTLWNVFGRRPTAGEYRALAELCIEAATKCEEDAVERGERPADACPDCERGISYIASGREGDRLVRGPCPTCKGSGKRAARVR